MEKELYYTIKFSVPYDFYLKLCRLASLRHSTVPMVVRSCCEWYVKKFDDTFGDKK